MNKYYEEIPWPDFQAIAVQHFGFEFTGIDSFLNRKGINAATDGPVIPIPAAEKYDDIKLIKYIEGPIKSLEPHSYLYVLTYNSYSKGSPIKLYAQHLPGFIGYHQRNFKEYFYSTEVEIISFETMKGWIYHHEDVFYSVDFKACLSK